MRPTNRIRSLCESWWERVSDATKEEQERAAGEFLALLGWKAPEPLEPASTWEGEASAAYLLRGRDVSPVGAFFVTPGALTPPGVLRESRLDFCPATRRLVTAARSRNLPYVFITDLFRSYLYDVNNEEILLAADDPAGFEGELAHALHCEEVERGSLQDARREPRSALARQLREWRDARCEAIKAEAPGLENELDLLMDRLMVLRRLIGHELLKSSGWDLQKRFSGLLNLAASAEPAGCGAELTGLFGNLWERWRCGLFRPIAELDAVMSKDHVAGPLLREFGLLSRSKFHLATVLESFNYGDAAEKARVRMIPEENRERMAYLARQTIETIDDARISVDLLDEGYRAMFQWFDRLVTIYEQLETEYDHEEAAHANREAEELDLFDWSELNAKRPAALTDRYEYAVEQGLQLYYASDRQYRTARLLLYLHLISRLARSKRRLTSFPDVERALEPRPGVLDNDRKAIYDDNAAGSAAWDVV